MLRWCVAEQPDRSVHLIYGVRNGRERAFGAVLDGILREHPHVRLTVVYSRPATGTYGRDYQHAGHVDIDLIRQSISPGHHRFYICGPPPMMESLIPALVAWGVPDEDIHFEAFGPASLRPAIASGSGDTVGKLAQVNVNFSRSARTIAWEGREDNLLEFAENHGIEVESGCRSGGCGSCETKLLSGDVIYARKPDFDVSPGHCLLCVARPSSPVSLEA